MRREKGGRDSRRSARARGGRDGPARRLGRQHSGAPGIGDKGSVELIKRFGTVEQALDRAAEVEKKSYRESLENNRDTVLFSKRMATIDCDVPVDLT